MQQDFVNNNDNPDYVSTGRSFRMLRPTPASPQYREERTKQAASLTRRRGRHPSASETPLVVPQNAPFANAHSHTAQSSPQASSDSFPHQPLDAAFPQNNQPDRFPQNNPAYVFPQNSPNPFYSTHQTQLQFQDWNPTMMQDMLYTMPASGYDGLDMSDNDEHYSTHQSFSDIPGDSTVMNNTIGSTADIPAAPALPLASLSGTPSSSAPSTTGTPQNLRLFPQANASISSTPVVSLVPRKRKVGAIIDSDPPVPASSPSEPSAVARRPLIRRVDIFGSGLHDNRQRPLTPSAPTVGTQDKENEILDDVSDAETSPPQKKKSRKARGSRSIRTIQDTDPVRAKIIAAGFDYVHLMVLTKEKSVFLEGRGPVAVLAQDAFDFGAEKLGHDPAEFSPLTAKEEDLNRQEIYTIRKTFKSAARIVVKGGDGYGFVERSRNDSAETLTSTATKNRDIVATVTNKSALVFAVPSDRTIKGSMYKHPAIQAMAECTVFKNILSLAVQYPDWFDEAPLPEGDAISHKPRFSAVTLNVMILALRAAINEWSSGHWVPEVFRRRLYNKQFTEDLKAFRDWQEFTSKPTVLTGHVPTRTIPPSFLAQTFQESITEKARYNLFKDVVAPVPSIEVLGAADFALNQ
ncbi:hypothetical protein B0H16DRAFT_1832099 [Mycena metata]|uniref:DUF6532 domain-containing protein n=1 Tax=Mycena metata TaxID=1033252 RepID=A0AAD7E0K1_9AGAR|nr:hypothetical protein B0H16DRAFT_1832099 [Mycena metata]